MQPLQCAKVQLIAFHAALLAISAAGTLLLMTQGFVLQGPLYFWSYVYYLSKYYEFLDTFILVWKVGTLNSETVLKWLCCYT